MLKLGVSIYSHLRRGWAEDTRDLKLVGLWQL
jgi:hypothetical protein